MSKDPFALSVEKRIKKTLSKFLYSNELKKACEYALFPSGKYFRPLLIEAFAKDRDPSLPESLEVLAAIVELHHTYTLIHDDLPSMDDDDFRRGRPSLHKKFNEGKAILSGDSLLLLSFQLIQELPEKKRIPILKLLSHLTGGKGLIEGQWRDLYQKASDFSSLMEVQRLKTANLMIFCTLGAEILVGESTYKSYRLGRNIGLIFQVLDDLQELTENIDEQEQSKNTWVLFPQLSFQFLQFKGKQTLAQLEKHPHTRTLLSVYFLKVAKKVSQIESYLPSTDLKWIQSWLESFEVGP